MTGNSHSTTEDLEPQPGSEFLGFPHRQVLPSQSPMDWSYVAKNLLAFILLQGSAPTTGCENWGEIMSASWWQCKGEMLRATTVGKEQERAPRGVGEGCSDWLWRILKQMPGFSGWVVTLSPCESPREGCSLEIPVLALELYLLGPLWHRGVAGSSGNWIVFLTQRL